MVAQGQKLAGEGMQAQQSKQTTSSSPKRQDYYHTSQIQRATIDKLRSDNNKLKEEVMIENKFSIQPSNPAAAAYIIKLQDEADAYTRKIEFEKKKIGLLEIKLKEQRQRLEESRKKMGGIFSAQDANQSLLKKITQLEARLELVNIKYNEAMFQTQKLRDQIDNMRRERLVFDGIYRKLEKELSEKKREMAKIIEQVSESTAIATPKNCRYLKQRYKANKANENKEQAINQIALLKAHADREQSSFEQEWKHLTSIIEQDRKARELARQKEMEDRERQTMELLKSKELATNLKGKKSQKGQQEWKQKATQHISMEKIQQYGEAFAKIQQGIGIQDIDELVNTFINAEDENFTLFNYVNELNEEIEKLEEQIRTIQQEIKEYQNQGAQADNERRRILRELEEELQEIESKAEQQDKEYETSLKVINEVKSNIWNIFNRMGCNKASILEILGETEINEYNIIKFMGIIEIRADEILMQYANNKLEKGEDVEHIAAALGQTQGSNVVTTRVAIQPPSTNDDVIDEETDDEKPLTQESLHARVMKSIARKGESAFKTQAMTNLKVGAIKK